MISQWKGGEKEDGEDDAYGLGLVLPEGEDLGRFECKWSSESFGRVGVDDRVWVRSDRGLLSTEA
jgi:hypothetical protein